MDLKWKSAFEKDYESEFRIVRHCLYDAVSGRVFGYVQEPGPAGFVFLAYNYAGDDRRYMSLATAQSYLEQVAIQVEAEERRKDEARERKLRVGGARKKVRA